MKHLKDFKEEIHRCSKCGLCQAACPVYQETGNDCSVSRGQFIMLDGVIKGDLKLSRKINKYLDTCLKCDKCTKFCPTGIDIVQIILAAKHEYFKHSFRGKIYKFLESKLVFNTLLNVLGAITSFRRKKPKKLDNPTAKVVYFGGCIEKIKPEIRNFVLFLLNKMNIEVIDVPFNCCGIQFMTTGNLDRFIEQAEENVSKLQNIKFDYIVTDCASCKSTLESYINYVENEELKQRLETIKFRSIYELLAESGIKFSTKKEKTVTYHKPCHESDLDSILKIISECNNVKYVEMENFDECCGFAGFEHPWTLKTISKIITKKGKNIKATKSDYVLTSCIGCIVSMSISTLFRKKIKRLISFLKDDCTIDN